MSYRICRLIGLLSFISIALVAAVRADRPAERGAVPGQPPYDPGEWVLVANHLHSAPGGSAGWASGVKHILEYCSARNIEFAFMTDHNTIGHWFFPTFRLTGHTLPVGGMEWTSSQGHANLVGFTATTPDGAILPCGGKAQPPCSTANTQDHAGMVASVHSRDGIVIINHPVLKHYSWPDAGFGADAVEVNRTWSDQEGKGARAWWHRRLLRGERLTAFGGSDYHYFRPLTDDVQRSKVDPDAEDSSPWSPDIDNPTNLIRVQEKTIPAVLAAVRAGHVQVLRDLKQPRVLIGCDANGDGRFDDYMMGDKVRATPGSKLAFQVRVLGGKGQNLSVIDARVGDAPAQTRVETVAVDSDDFVFALERVASEAKDRFLRTEIGDVGGNVANPIYY